MELNNTALQMLDMFPSWMKIRKDPENSQGAALVNALGSQISDIDDLISNILTVHFPQLDPTSIDGINIASVDVLYKVYVDKSIILAKNIVVCDGKELQAATSVYDFYKGEADQKYYFNTYNNIIYFRKKFENITLNNATLISSDLNITLIEHNVWGPYDEIGLLFGCPRIEGELNSAYRLRLLDVFTNPGNSTRKGLKNFISRSLNIGIDDVVIQDLDDDFVKSLINDDGTLKLELKEYINISNRINLATTNTYWDILEESRIGLSYLPLIWNTGVNKWDEKDIQNGIGDTDDLEIIGPQQESTVQEFDYHVGVQGLKLSKDDVYPQHEFKYKLIASGVTTDKDDFKPEEYKYTVTASEYVELEMDVTASKEYETTITLPFDDKVNYFSGDTDSLIESFTANFVDYTQTTTDKHKNDFVTRDVILAPGSKVMHNDYRYIEVAAKMSTKDTTTSPVLRSISVKYTDMNDVQKTIRITADDIVSRNGDITSIGFESNTWSEQTPIIKVKDSNENYMVNVSDDHMTLEKGTYRKSYNSTGDWQDGTLSNISITNRGTLKLSTKYL